jgi:hypothetical protein
MKSVEMIFSPSHSNFIPLMDLDEPTPQGNGITAGTIYFSIWSGLFFSIDITTMNILLMVQKKAKEGSREIEAPPCVDEESDVEASIVDTESRENGEEVPMDSEWTRTYLPASSEQSFDIPVSDEVLLAVEVENQQVLMKTEPKCTRIDLSAGMEHDPLSNQVPDAGEEECQEVLPTTEPERIALRRDRFYTAQEDLLDDDSIVFSA